MKIPPRELQITMVVPYSTSRHHVQCGALCSTGGLPSSCWAGLTCLWGPGDGMEDTGSLLLLLQCEARKWLTCSPWFRSTDSLLLQAGSCFCVGHSLLCQENCLIIQEGKKQGKSGEGGRRNVVTAWLYAPCAGVFTGRLLLPSCLYGQQREAGFLRSNPRKGRDIG